MTKPAIPFSAQQHVPVIGQPFTLHEVYVPANARLTCNCGGAETQVEIVASVAAACPSCHKVFNARFNPTNNRLEFQIAVPQEQVPS